MLNAQGLLGNLSEIRDILYNATPSIMCLTETHITENIDDVEINAVGYSIVRGDTESKHTGGVVLYIRNASK